MSMDKKQAARQAAAKYSTNPMAAAVEYGKMTKQIDSSFEFDESNMKQFKVVIEIRDEMLKLLEPYRHPAGDMFVEWMWFVDLAGLEIKGKIYKEPKFFRLLKKESLPASIIKATEEYVKEAETAKLKLGECKHELEGLKEKFEGAKWIYYEEKWSEPSHKRNAAVVQYLGFSTGRARKKYEKKDVYIEYLSLVRKKGLSRKDATKRVKRFYGIKSFDATLKVLHDYRTTFINKCQGKVSPEVLEIVKKRLKGFILSRR